MTTSAIASVNYAVRNDRRGDNDQVKNLLVTESLTLAGVVNGSLTSTGSLVGQSVAGGVELVEDEVPATGLLGALDSDVLTSAVVTSQASTGSLPDGRNVGQLKIVVLATDGGDYVLTPDTLANGTTLTFANAGESALLVWAASAWHVVSTSAAVA